MTVMASGLQRLVDRLSRYLKCPVVIDDLNTQQLVYSLLFGPLNDSLRNSVLSRSTDQRVLELFSGLDVPSPERPVRVAAKKGIGVESCVYMPIKHQRELLGHLWVFDKENHVKDADFRHVLSVAKAAALFLRRQELISDLDRRREKELLRDLLSVNDEAQRANIAEDLIGSGLFPPRSPMQVLVVRPVHPGYLAPDQAARAEIGKVMEDVRSSLTRGFSLDLVRHDHGLLAVSPLDPAIRSKSTFEVARELQCRLSASMDEAAGNGWSVIAGVGGEHELTEALTSYEQALHAVRVATVSPNFGAVVAWADLGSYRILSQFALEKVAPEALHPGVMALARSDDDQALLQTLETYLDFACDAKATAAELFIHRATLYYRLKRVSEIVGADLTSGDDRLAIHLSLKLGRLKGLLGQRATRGANQTSGYQEAPD